MADGVGGGNDPYVNAPSNGFRDSLGGMPIQDLTAQLSPAQRAPYASSYVETNSAIPVGSGLASGANPVSLASATSFAASSPGANSNNPADRMRPMEPGYSVTPPPRYRGIESSISTPQPAPVQPVANRNQVDSWQTPAANNPASGTGVANAAYTAPKQPTGSNAPRILRCHGAHQHWRDKKILVSRNAEP